MIRKRFNVLSDLITINNYQTMVEIGVGKGEVLRHLHWESVNPTLLWYGVDPYEVYDEYVNDINGTAVRVRQNKNVILNLLKKYTEKGHNYVLYQQRSEEVVNFFKDNSVDLIFVDGNHSYDYVRQDIELWWPKVKSHGCVAFHDYNLYQVFPGVKKAVNEFIKQNGLKLRKDSDIVYIYKV